MGEADAAAAFARVRAGCDQPARRGGADPGLAATVWTCLLYTSTIFRVAHSIKGGAATFGFGQITSFTHTLETLLDELRGQRMKVTTALSDLLLRSVDVLREMLRAQQGKQPVDAQRVADLQFDLELTVVQKLSLIHI